MLYIFIRNKSVKTEIGLLSGNSAAHFGMGLICLAFGWICWAKFYWPKMNCNIGKSKAPNTQLSRLKICFWNMYTFPVWRCESTLFKTITSRCEAQKSYRLRRSVRCNAYFDVAGENAMQPISCIWVKYHKSSSQQTNIDSRNVTLSKITRVKNYLNVI